MLELDRRLFTYLNSTGNPEWDGFWLLVTDKWTAIPIYLILLFIGFRQLGFKKLLILLVTVALLITVTDQLSNFFKYGVQRLRPCHDPELLDTLRLVKARCGGQYGYFSAHAANSFGVATFFSMLFRNKFKWLPYLLFLWALLVGYSRIYIGVHYPLDILSGAGIGVLFGWLFTRLYVKFINRFTTHA